MPSDISHQPSAISHQVELRPNSPQSRVDCTPENIEQGLAKLVLSLIELLRQLLERQAIRRMEGGTLSDQQIEDMGQALMKLETKIRELAEQFGLSPADLNLDLGQLNLDSLKD
jgi:predicted Rossmann fold nucleotide-binding protein DprA/Smf involved in DNA uptake